jgi:2',3'-cyclic-nucleotide 2'-phosphodiesterase (5'-nucleotidase family)
MRQVYFTIPRQSVIALVLLVVSGSSAEVRSLTILHTNDLHARISPLENKNGGFAYLARIIQRERAGCHDCIVLNAGDLVQGSPVSTIFHGLPVFEIANLLGFDAMALGNHEFDYGWMQTRKFIQTSKYPVVCANVVNDRGETLTPKPYLILNVNRLRVAVIGAMTDELRTLSKPTLLGEWHTVPLVETARKYASELRQKSDIIVLLGHIETEEESEILNSVPDIAVLVTGHVHRGMEQPRLRDGRVQVRVKGYGEELGRLELKVDTEKKALASWNWKRIPVDSTQVEPVAEVARLVKRWEDDVKARVDQPIAISKKNFTKPQIKRLIEQAMRDQTGADFAHMNLGGVRDILPQGQLLARHIWNIMPFDNLVVAGRFKGKDLPPVVVGDRKIEPEREYTLVVSDYTAANQETPENLRTSGLVFNQELGLLRDLLLDWFRRKKVVGD